MPKFSGERGRVFAAAVVAVLMSGAAAAEPRRGTL